MMFLRTDLVLTALNIPSFFGHGLIVLNSAVVRQQQPAGECVEDRNGTDVFLKLPPLNI